MSESNENSSRMGEKQTELTEEMNMAKSDQESNPPINNNTDSPMTDHTDLAGSEGQNKQTNNQDESKLVEEGKQSSPNGSMQRSKSESGNTNDTDDSNEEASLELSEEASQDNTSSCTDLPLNNTHSSQEQLKNDLPRQEDSKPETGPVKKDSDYMSGASCSGSNNGSKLSESSESIYHLKWIHFKNKQVPVITQNENGPCPLLAIMNVLLLQSRVKLAPETEIISANQLMVYLGDCVLESVPSDDGVSTPARLNFEQNMSDAMTVMHKLQTGLDVNVKFTGISHFEYTSECIIFDLLQIALYHGWLVDPQNEAEVAAVGKCSYNQLVEKIITDKTSDQPDAVNNALIAEHFLALSASQLTYHGLCELSSQLKEDEIAVLFRNNHFTTLYRHKNELFQLVTDQGFLNESNVVWETLSNVEGDCHFVDSEFRTYTKPAPLLHAVEPPHVPLNSEEQIDQDYLVALSLQQEQQQEQLAWGPMVAPPMSDLELAQNLQAEERRAAEEEAQRQQALHQQNLASNPAQRRQARTHEHREEKKSDCHIL